MKLFVENYNSVMDDVLEHFDLVDNVYDADKVLLWNDVNYWQRAIVELAHAYGKKAIVMQHGRRGTSRYFPPFNEKIVADVLLVWGERDKQALVEAGHPESKIKVVGTTLFAHLKQPKKHKEVNIVFCPEHWDVEVDESIQTAKKLREIATRNQWKILTKTLPSHNPEFYDNPVLSDRNKPGHMEVVANLLKKADVVVGISESTFELFAQYLDIPVIIMSEWKPKSCNGDARYKSYRRIVSEASIQATLETLEKEIKSQLDNPRELADARMVVVAEEGGIGESSLDRIIEEIEHA